MAARVQYDPANTANMKYPMVTAIWANDRAKDLGGKLLLNNDNAQLHVGYQSAIMAASTTSIETVLTP